MTSERKFWTETLAQSWKKYVVVGVGVVATLCVAYTLVRRLRKTVTLSSFREQIMIRLGSLASTKR